MSKILSKTIQFPPLTKSKFKFFRLPQIKVNTVDDYFSLPKNEREKYGFYLLPLGLPFTFFNKQEKTKGWKEFYAEIKKEYPVQYFFRQWMFSYENPIYSFLKTKLIWPVKELKWNIHRFLKPCHPRWRKVLPRHKYSDITELIINSNFALILDFYYEEVKKGIVDWRSDDKHTKFYKELLNAVKWIEKDRNNHLDKLDKSLSLATKKPVMKKSKLDYLTTYKGYHKLENELKNKDTKILTWFIENREFFWT